MSRPVLVVVLCLVALAGCTPGATVAGFQAEMKNAGYEVQGVEHDGPGRDGVLQVSLAMPALPTDSDWEEICKIAWTGYPDDFDELQVRVNGELRLSMTWRELKAQYGARP
jgi:hypothetical protein